MNSLFQNRTVVQNGHLFGSIMAQGVWKTTLWLIMEMELLTQEV